MAELTKHQRIGKRSNRKGNEGEREALKLLGERARRGFGDRVSGDIRIIHGELEGKIEVKREKRPLPRAYSLIEGHRAVMVRGNNEEWLMVLRAKDVVAVLDRIEELERTVKAQRELIEAARVKVQDAADHPLIVTSWCPWEMKQEADDE